MDDLPSFWPLGLTTFFVCVLAKNTWITKIQIYGFIIALARLFGIRYICWNTGYSKIFIHFCKIQKKITRNVTQKLQLQQKEDEKGKGGEEGGEPVHQAGRGGGGGGRGHRVHGWLSRAQVGAHAVVLAVALHQGAGHPVQESLQVVGNTWNFM